MPLCWQVRSRSGAGSSASVHVPRKATVGACSGTSHNSQHSAACADAADACVSAGLCMHIPQQQSDQTSMFTVGGDTMAEEFGFLHAHSSSSLGCHETHTGVHAQAHSANRAGAALPAPRQLSMSPRLPYGKSAFELLRRSRSDGVVAEHARASPGSGVSRSSTPLSTTRSSLDRAARGSSPHKCRAHTQSAVGRGGERARDVSPTHEARAAGCRCQSHHSAPLSDATQRPCAMPRREPRTCVPEHVDLTGGILNAAFSAHASLAASPNASFNRSCNVCGSLGIGVRERVIDARRGGKGSSL
eukprot:2120063-Pleurochrysis_carterae.AAC.1